MMQRRTFLKQIIVSVPILALSPKLFAQSTANALKFGWVTDIHYAKAPVKWNRYFDQSISKLTEVVECFNSNDLDFAIETGDFKDQTEPPVEHETLAYLKMAEETFAKYNGPRYHVLGNHDLDSISKQQFQSIIKNTGIDYTQTFYSIETKGFLIVVLDACFSKDGNSYNKGNFKWYDTFIPNDQIDWLEKTLADHDLPTLVFVHQLLDGRGNLYVKNASKVRRVLEQSKKVVAVFQGHKHEGDYHAINGIHYITQKALVDGDGPEQNSYSIVEVAQNQLTVTGFRRADEYVLPRNIGTADNTNQVEKT
jgi:predicted phosphodiesterase